MDDKVINHELELKEWFINNYKTLGYSKIIRKDIGVFPDFIMLKNNKEVRVELETLSSHFTLHKHKINDVDEIVCIKNDFSLGVPTIEIDSLRYHNKLKRVSATIEPETNEILKKLIKTGEYRNKSHLIEEAIRLMEGKENDK